MEEHFDVVVVGGGPSGGQFARTFAKNSDFSVAVLEKDDNLGDNDKSTAGTFKEVVEDREIPERVVMDQNESVLFEGPTESTRLPMRNWVLDFSELQEFLGEDAESEGAEIMTGHRVEGPLVEDGSIKGVQVNYSGEIRSIGADIVVDASGAGSVIASRMGYSDRKNADTAAGVEYLMEGEYSPSDSMLFRFDSRLAPGGYAWMFPSGDGLFKIGVCALDDLERFSERDMEIDDLVEGWVYGNGRWSGEKIEIHRGGAQINSSINTRAADGFMAVGDSVSSINPVFGEGIRPGMEAADRAAEVAVRALERGDTSERTLKEYERWWNREKGGDWRKFKAVKDMLYSFDNRKYDRFVRGLSKLDEREVEKLRSNEVSRTAMLKAYPYSVSDIIRLPRMLLGLF